MKKLLCLIAFVSTTIVNAATNAPAKPQQDVGALFKMHWENRVRSFKEQNLAWQNVVLLGDSITEGFEVTKYFPGRRVLNRGIGADVIGNDMPTNDFRGLLQRLDNSVFDCAPTDVFILIGINDLGSGRKVETLEAGYRELLKRLRARRPDLRIYVQSVLPTRDRFEKHNAPVCDFNKRLKKLATKFGCSFIDLHALMVDENGELKAEFTKDGLHLTEPAYLIWREQILNAMKWN
ncbi:MAG: GDSL-type esterase/lipase family protein [Limisphaerales bacterium]